MAIQQPKSTPNFKTPNSSFNVSFNGNTPTNNASGRKSMNSDEKRGIERFRRVKEEEVAIDERVVDNSFEAKVSVLKYFPGEETKRRSSRKLLDTILRADPGRNLIYKVLN